MRFRLSVRCLMLAVLAIGVAIWGVKYYLTPRPPLPPPWFNTTMFPTNNSYLYLHGDDVRNGVVPPRAKLVHWSPRGVRITNVRPGTRGAEVVERVLPRAKQQLAFEDSLSAEEAERWMQMAPNFKNWFR